MNAAVSASTSPAKEKWNFALSQEQEAVLRKRIGGPARQAGSLISDDTDSPLSRKSGDVHEPGDLGRPASVITTAAVGVTDEQYGPALARRSRCFVTRRRQPETAWLCTTTTS